MSDVALIYEVWIMELKFYFELLDKIDDMSFSNHDDKKRFAYIIRRIIKKMTEVWDER